MTIRCVVAAVDGSEESLHAVDWAADEAARRGVGLRLVHASVWERYERETEDEGEGDAEAVRGAVRDLLATAAERAAAGRPDLEVGTEVLAEEPVSALLGLGGRAPLLVMGSRGRGGFLGLLLGSVSLRVAAHATYPVVVVRGGQQGRPRGRVVLGVGEHDPEGPAVGFAVEEARLRNAELDLVHGWHPDPDLSGFSVLIDAGAPALIAEDLLAAVVLPDSAAGLTVKRRAMPGRAAHTLLQAGAEADLIVLSARRRHGATGLQLGPVNHAVLHHAPCPVAVVPLP